jgi:hypothetical protein
VLVSNGSGAPVWVDPSTIVVGKTKVLDNYYTYSTRPTSLNIKFGDGGLRTFKATSATTEGKCTVDGHIIHLAWDTTDGWDNQLALTGANYGKNFGIQFRGQNEGTWSDWHPVLTDLNYHEYLGYIGTTAVQKESKDQALTGISSATISGVTSTNTLTISNTGAVGHINFSRGSYNYITMPSEGVLHILPDGARVASNNGMVFSSKGLHPATNSAYSLGTSNLKWSWVYT